MATGNDEILNRINYSRVYLMICIILYHCFAFWTGGWFTKNPVNESVALCYLAKYLNTFHIYSFTFISGYVFYYTVFERVKERIDKQSFFLKKARRLIVPYYFVVFIWIIPIETFFHNYTWTEIIRMYILGTSPNQLWFLLMLFWVQVLFFMFKDEICTSKYLSFIIAGFLYVTGYGLSYLLPKYNVFCVFNALLHCFTFLLGYKIRQYRLEGKISWKFLVPMHVILYFAVMHLDKNSSLAGMAMRVILQFFMFNVGAAGYFDFFNWLSVKVSPKLIRDISPHTMCMFMFHQQIIYIFIVWLNGRTYPVVIAMIAFAGTFLSALAISRVLHISRVTRFLIGDK